MARMKPLACLLLLPLVACTRGRPGDSTGESSAPIDTHESADSDDSGVEPPVANYTLSWGDLHAHTNLSHDGCEDPDNLCLPESDLPGELLYVHAAAKSFAFVANTDHAEIDTWSRLSDGLSVQSWDRSHEMLAAAGPTGVLPILGYEYTAIAGHRTVIFDGDEVCATYRKSSHVPSEPKAEVGLESYTFGPTDDYGSPADLEAALDAAGEADGCDPVPWISFAHHPAFATPTATYWTDDRNRIDSDRVVEIASEHGSSECEDITQEDCDYRVIEQRYDGDGSVQTALRLGYRLGFVGGSDNHEGTATVPGDEPGYNGTFIDTDGDGIGDTPAEQSFAGAITGVYHDGTLTRPMLFDALNARHSLAATWSFDSVTLHAYDSEGVLYLPGDDLPAGTYTLVVDVADEDLSSWVAEIVDPTDGSVTEETEFEVTSGSALYVRVRADVSGVEHRIWASPFFGG